MNEFGEQKRENEPEQVTLSDTSAEVGYPETRKELIEQKEIAENTAGDEQESVSATVEQRLNEMAARMASEAREQLEKQTSAEPRTEINDDKVNAKSMEVMDESMRREAQMIAHGHAFKEHLQDFPGIKTATEFQARLEDIMGNPDHVKTLRNNRVAYWDDESRTVIISDPNSEDGGTAFRPENGKAYFNNSLK